MAKPETYMDKLVIAQDKGWVKIIGSFEQDPGDVRAVITEHYDVKHITTEDLQE